MSPLPPGSAVRFRLLTVVCSLAVSPRPHITGAGRQDILNELLKTLAKQADAQGLRAVLAGMHPTDDSTEPSGNTGTMLHIATSKGQADGVSPSRWVPARPRICRGTRAVGGWLFGPGCRSQPLCGPVAAGAPRCAYAYAFEAPPPPHRQIRTTPSMPLNSSWRIAWACRIATWHCAQVRTLLNAGADPSLKDSDGKSTLELAAGQPTLQAAYDLI